MKIRQFEYENKNSELKINPIAFSDISLLVGASGAGKTLILKAILDLKNISQGKSSDGAEWEIRFATGKDDDCLWKGSFEKTEFTENDLYGDEDQSKRPAPLPKILYEELFFNNQPIVERKGNEIKLKGHLTPKLSSYKSAVNLFNEEEIISPIYDHFNKIIQSDDSDVKSLIPVSVFESDKFLKKYTSLEQIRNAPVSIYLKLEWAYKNKTEVFDTVKENFINVFNQVEDIRLEPLKGDLPVFLRDLPLLQIKEKNVSKWIPYKQISSGMFKTLMQISQLFLCAEGSVILIDEFENSLGINCIDTLTENLIYEGRDLQFILTSHHPYIINAIGMEYWKIVSRTGSVISAKDAKEYKLGNSRHEAFKQLIQLNDYRNGIKT